MRSGHTFAIHTLGCKLNFSESSAISDALISNGMGKVGLEERPDVVVLNTCSVTENADKKCRQFVRKYKSANPDLFVIVIGCYAQLKPAEIGQIEGVNLVLGANDKFKIAEHLKEIDEKDRNLVISGPIKEVRDFNPSFSHGDRTRSFLKVQDGCDYFCTFCTIPLARGLSRSASLAETVEQANRIAEKGIKEVVLTGVNIGDFGKDSEENFYNLIQALDEIEGIDRFRISSIEPNLLSKEIIDFVAESKKFMPHFHIPLQSGSDVLLKEMKRKYDTRLYRDTVEYIKQKMPHACIGVDVIVGFPGETDELFEETRSFLIDLEVSYLHVFTYSERKNTKAYRMEGSVDVGLRRERSRQLQHLSIKLKRAFYQRFAGSEMPVLLEKYEDGKLGGFTPNYIRVTAPGSPSDENSIQYFHLDSVNMDVEMKANNVSKEILTKA